MLIESVYDKEHTSTKVFYKSTGYFYKSTGYVGHNLNKETLKRKQEMAS